MTESWLGRPKNSRLKPPQAEKAEQRKKLNRRPTRSMSQPAKRYPIAILIPALIAVG